MGGRGASAGSSAGNVAIRQALGKKGEPIAINQAMEGANPNYKLGTTE